MNYGELQTKVASYLHRTDLAFEVKEFIATATEMINRRFDAALAPLVADTDTNDVLTSQSSLYLYSALAEGYAYLHNGDAMTTYMQRWDAECDKVNILQPGTILDPYAAAPPQITVYEAT